MKFERTHGSHKEGNEEVRIWLDERTRSVMINATTALRSEKFPGGTGYPGITVNKGQLELVPRNEGEVVADFLVFSQPVLEDFPGILIALYKALQDFFGDSLDKVPASEKHLADMRKIVETKLGVEFND